MTASSRSRIKPGLKRVIAERVLWVCPPGERRKRVVVRLGIPARRKKKTRGDAPWECPFEVRGLGAVDGIKTNLGEDSLQALRGAMTGIRAMILRSEKEVRWFPDAPGIGLPASVPEDLGREFEELVEALYSSELKKRGYGRTETP